jgi:CheY-like chemotaxis protein
MTTVILAEPEASARWVGTREFEAIGFTVFPAADEAELDRRLAQLDPAALVVDRRLVGPTGERLRRLRQDPRRQHTLCYVLALVPSASERQVLLEAGADWYIDKTALVGSLASAVRAQIQPVPSPAGRSPRVSPRTRISLPIEYSPRRRVDFGETRDLSAAGVFVRTPNPAGVGELVLLGFSVMGPRRLECFGRVQWNRQADVAEPFPAGMGLAFLDVQPGMTAALASPS